MICEIVVTGPVKRILVAVKEVEGGPSPALAKATQLALATGAQIELCHCVDAALTVQELAAYRNGIIEFETGQSRAWEKGLDRLASHARRHGVRVEITAPVDYPVHEAIVRQARQSRADLIVTDAHGGSGFAPGLMQEVDWELVRMSPVPLLIVRQQHLYDCPIVLAALDPGQSHSKPGTLDEKILGFAEAIGSALQGAVHAMHAYPFPVAYAEASAVASAGVAAELQAIDASQARSALDRVLAASHIPSDRRHVFAGSPSDAIVSTAAHLGASLVVMGSVGRSGIGGLFIGNTAERVLNRLSCDLLLLKPAEFRDSISDQRRGARVVPSGMYY